MKALELNGTLPGQELVWQGLVDLREGKQTIASCLVQVARTRLARAGLMQSSVSKTAIEAELQLYELLRAEGGDAYSRYNSLLGELVSFENALDHKQNNLA